MTQHRIHYGQNEFTYQICYVATRQNKVAIHVHPDGSVQVDAPPNTELPDIREAVQKRARWVIKHLSKLQEQGQAVLPRTYVSGETHFYLGRRYLLKICKGKDCHVKLSRGQFQIQTDSVTLKHIKRLLWAWYREHATHVFQKRLEEIYANLHWVKEAPKWKLLAMKKQWGSCSPKGIVSLNPHLVKAPRECVDYVILHELCHLKEHNHSPKFYKLLDQNMPDWKARKVKLDGMAELLLNE
jgi:predicted metal-dependent hydrolase